MEIRFNKLICYYPESSDLSYTIDRVLGALDLFLNFFFFLYSHKIKTIINRIEKVIKKKNNNNTNKNGGK